MFPLRRSPHSLFLPGVVTRARPTIMLPFTTILHLVRDDEFVTIPVEFEAGYDRLGDLWVGQPTRLDTFEVVNLDEGERRDLEETAEENLGVCS